MSRAGEKAGRMGPIVVSDHARMRLDARRIPAAAVEMAFLFGRERHVKGATYFVIGRKEVERHRLIGVELGRFEGIHVVCAEDEVVVTAFRNRDLSGLRPRGSRRKRRGRGWRQPTVRAGEAAA